MSYNLAKSSLTFSFMTLLSRVLGFVRDMVAAFIFGAGPGYDAFVLSFRIPNLLRRLFAEGAFSQAFVPVLSEYQATRGEGEVKDFINHVSGNLASVLLVVTVVGILTAPWIIYGFAPGFVLGGERQVLAIEMLRLTFPYIFFISLTAFAGSILNTHQKFAASAFTPVLLNISLIVASCFIAPHMQCPELALAWGVLIAGVVQLGFQVPFLIKINALPRPQINWRDPAVRRVLILMPPAIFGAAISQITLLVDSWFASFLVIGSISWLYYADRLMEFPLGIIGVGLATVILPSLSKYHAKGDREQFNNTLDWGLRCVLLIGIPAALGLFMLAGPLIATLFYSGKFIGKDVVMTQQCLMAYALAVIGIMVAKIFSSAFYATQNIKTPVKISMGILVVNVTLNASLINLYAHVGLALATSITAVINALCLGYKWHAMHKLNFSDGWYHFVGQLFVANLGMFLFLYALRYDLNVWLNWQRSYRVIMLSGLVTGGGLIYVSILLLTGVRPRQFVLRAATV